MKKIILLFVFALISTITYSQIVVFENFENGMPAGWSSTVWMGNCDFQLGTDLPTGDDFPTIGVFYDDDACGNNTDVNSLVLKSIPYDLYPATTATLTVDVAFQESGDQRFTLSAWDGNMWNTLDEFDQSLNPAIQTFTYDVSPYISWDMTFAFGYTDDPDSNGVGSWGWHGGIDNFLLEGSVLSIEDNTITGFNMYPNPADEVLNISANENIDQIVVYDMLGRKIMEQSLNSTSSQIDISAITTGTYFLQVTAGSQQDSYQFIKK